MYVVTLTHTLKEKGNGDEYEFLEMLADKLIAPPQNKTPLGVKMATNNSLNQQTMPSYVSESLHIGHLHILHIQT